MGSTVTPECATWKRAPAHWQVCLWRCVSSAVAFPCSWIGGRSRRQLCSGLLGNALIQHYPLTLFSLQVLKLFPMGITDKESQTRGRIRSSSPLNSKEKLITSVIIGVVLEPTWAAYHKSFYSCQSLFRLQQFPARAGIYIPPKQLYSSKCYVH